MFTHREGKRIRYSLKLGTTWTTWNDLRRARNNLKRPTTTYNEQERTWNDLQRARNDLKRPTINKTQPTVTWTHLQQAKKRLETTNNKQIFRLFYIMGQTVLFSNTFSTQHLIAVIRAFLHGGTWWKQSIKHLLSCVKCQLSRVSFTGYVIYFFLSGFRVSRERERLLF